MKLNIDIDGIEQQRYNSIKAKGEYLEIDILVGTEKEQCDGHDGRMPVVSTAMHGVGPTEVACAYLTLKALIKQFESNYPAECLYGSICMNSHSLGVIRNEVKHDRDKEDQSENNSI